MCGYMQECRSILRIAVDNQLSEVSLKLIDKGALMSTQEEDSVKRNYVIL